ncbi:CHAT domain-containing protein [Thelonectria olida]|uniref:CHAT domain-containing protein n=1 Tax=Thelonectria olida TaxID=1576542 RepID=A0A9P8VX89_9HYPO|nr:CHAT domain-containing protein [Thelonectria olida]
MTKDKAMEDLDAFVQQCQEALDITPETHPDRASQLENLADGYQARYMETGVVKELETAIQQYHKALASAPENHPDQVPRFYKLGNSYRAKYQRTKAIPDLEAAIRHYQRALDLTPDNHPERTRRLSGLSYLHRYRYHRVKETTDLDVAIQLCQQALDHSPSPPMDRLHSARSLLELYAHTLNWLSVHEVASTAVSLMHSHITRALEHSDKQNVIDEVGSFASDGAAAALNAGKEPYDAVRLLELGRGIITSSLNDIQADQSEVERERLDATPTEDELKSAAVRGPIVILNVSDYDCHALIVEKGQLRALELPRLKTESEAIDPEFRDTELLEWLWDTIAEPVLDVLGFTKPPRGDWPRVWWIPTGPLTKLPIHAAGRYAHGSSDTVLDRVISSYSSSIRALLHNRQNRLEANTLHESEKMVLVGMEKTPGQSNLQFASEEIEELGKLGNSMQLQVIRPQPYRKDILSALNNCKIFHFAGHGQTDESDPLESALLLEDEPLTMRSLFQLNLGRKPFLAYLSACGTGQVKHEGLIDEGLHLINTYQLAGFQHVIGTLWKVDDRSCVDMAVTTYKWIQKRGLSDDSVSEGLHHACRELRTQWIADNIARSAAKRGTQVERKDSFQVTTELGQFGQVETRDVRDVEVVDDTPLHWVPYVHFGI